MVLRPTPAGASWTQRHTGLTGGVCVWFAASEHPGVPRAPPGLLGSEEAAVSRAGSWASSLLCHTLPWTGESKGGCSSAHPPISSLFFPVLNSFLTFSMPWLLLLLLLCVCQPGELRGLCPGCLSTSQSRLPAGRQRGHRGLIHPVPSRNASAGIPALWGCFPPPCNSIR